MEKKTELIRVLLWAVIVVILCGAFIGLMLREQETMTTDIAAPDSGEVLTADTGYSFADGTVQIDAEEIADIEISWLAGSVRVVRGTEPEIMFSENYSGSEKHRMQYKVDSGTLYIDMCAGAAVWDLPGKDLTLYLPEKKLDSLLIDVTSAQVYINDVIAQTLSVDSLSGKVTLSGVEAELLDVEASSGAVTAEALHAQEVQINTISGAVRAEGTFETAEVDTTSGAVQMSSSVLPEQIYVDTTSGKVTLILPEDSRFGYSFDTVSGEFSSELPGAVSGGDVRVRVDTTSGGLHFKVLG